MDVRLLYFDGCPNWVVAQERLRSSMASVGRGDERIELIRVETAEDAERLGFIGSPTILVDGRDPFATGTERPALACRVYPTSEGRDGSPTVDQLVEVLRRSGDGAACTGGHPVSRKLVGVCVLLAVLGLAGGLLAWTHTGPFTREPVELSFSPIEVRTLGEGGDPLAVMVVFPWSKDGFCSGQFTVSARETESAIVVSQVRGHEMPPGDTCAGIGSDGRTAAAPLMLRAPLGDRVVTRAVDGASMAVLDPCERAGVPSMCPHVR